MHCKLISLVSGLSLAACFSLATGFAPSAQDKVDAPADEAQVHSAYSINDLPLWSSDGKTFEPKLLIAFVKITLESKMDPGDEPATVKFYQASNSLIVSGTKKEHAQIQKLLETLRAE